MTGITFLRDADQYVFTIVARRLLALRFASSPDVRFIIDHGFSNLLVRKRLLCFILNWGRIRFAFCCDFQQPSLLSFSARTPRYWLYASLSHSPVRTCAGLNLTTLAKFDFGSEIALKKSDESLRKRGRSGRGEL